MQPLQQRTEHFEVLDPFDILGVDSPERFVVCRVRTAEAYGLAEGRGEWDGRGNGNERVRIG